MTPLKKAIGMVVATGVFLTTYVSQRQLPAGKPQQATQNAGAALPQKAMGDGEKKLAVQYTPPADENPVPGYSNPAGCP